MPLRNLFCLKANKQTEIKLRCVWRKRVPHLVSCNKAKVNISVLFRCFRSTPQLFAHAMLSMPRSSNRMVCLCYQGRALLHWACDRGHKELVSVLLQHKADINGQVSTNSSTLLSIAVRFSPHVCCGKSFIGSQMCSVCSVCVCPVLKDKPVC